jgi:hypothetical protein
VRALRRSGATVVPVFAQQSVRELERTGRTHREVLDAATWGALRAGWREGYGADADHLKEPDHVAAAAKVGFTMFTLDPSDHVDRDADAHDEAELRRRFDALPWDGLQTTAAELLARNRTPVELEHSRLAPADELEIVRAAVKVGRAIAHVVVLAASVPTSAEIEVSVDETPAPTSPFEHAFVAGELRRLGIEPIGLTPRFPGAFEKGVAYRGSLTTFAESVRRHAEIAAALGPYKLSLHSGSDKLELYPLLAEGTGGRFHIKTAGTSYLEALRTIATTDPGLFLEIWALARGRFEHDRASYEISAELRDVPVEPAPAELPALLDDDAARQILHVTFGTVLGDASLQERLAAALAEDGGEDYAAALQRHFVAHLEAIAA